MILFLISSKTAYLWKQGGRSQIINPVRVLQLLKQNNMNSELESYYHSSSPQRVLDKQMKPIIQHLQEANINSLHQLKMRLQQLPSDDAQGNLSRTLPVFVQPVNTLTKFYSQKQEKSSRKAQFSRTKRNSFTLSPTPKTLEISRQRIHMVSPVSKVKKHLIENINLQEMREALYKQRKTLNRFQQFCEFIKQKDRTPINKSRQKSFKETKGSIPSEEEFRSIDKNDDLNERFRITTRRKFWRQNRTSQSGEETSAEMLNITGFVKPFDKS